MYLITKPKIGIEGLNLLATSIILFRLEENFNIKFSKMNDQNIYL